MSTQNQDEVLQKILTEISGIKGEISDLRTEMKSGFGRLEDRILDVQDEMRMENVTTRTLLTQAFTHISDQIGHQDDAMNFVPKYPRVKK